MNIFNEITVKKNKRHEEHQRTSFKMPDFAENGVRSANSVFDTVNVGGFEFGGTVSNVGDENEAGRQISIFDTLAVPCPKNKIADKAARSGIFASLKSRSPVISGEAKLKYVKYEKLICDSMTCDVVELARLAEDIRRQGLLIPITVIRVKRGIYKVIEGNKRILAGKMVGMKDFLCLILPESAESCELPRLSVPDFEENFLDYCTQLWKDNNALSDPKGFEDQDKLREQCVLVGALAKKYYYSLPRVFPLLLRVYGKIAQLDGKYTASAIDELKCELEGLEMSLSEYIRDPKVKRNGKERIIFKDIALVFNSVENTVSRLASNGAVADCLRSENESEYIMHITVKKP